MLESIQAMTSLSVLVPVYNEQHLVAASLERLEILGESPLLSRVQVIVVDDCSRDATPEVLRRFEAAKARSKIEWVFLRHDRNRGKGCAIQTALAEATCDITAIHDADLEYHPKDLLRIVKVFEEENADAVFGSRFTGADVRRVLFFRHQIGNRLLTFLTNVVTDLNVSDMETCYKAVRTDLLKSIPLRSNDFRLEPELTIKLAKRGARLFEVPIRYSGRTYREGKKIGWRDGVKALAAIGRFALSEDLFVADQFGSETVARLSRAPHFQAWLADEIRPQLGARVLEIGSGTGDLTQLLLPRERYVATDVNPLCVRALQALEADRPYFRAKACDVLRSETFPEGDFDTVLCVDVLGSVEDDLTALCNIRGALPHGGRAVIVVPRQPSLRGTLDRAAGYLRRYDEASLRELAGKAGFEVSRLTPFNRAGTAGWWLGGTVLRRRKFDVAAVMALNGLTPVLRKVDTRLPLPPLSLLAVLEAVPAAAAVSAGR
jgi:SAM-dependent methyltransferase